MKNTYKLLILAFVATILTYACSKDNSNTVTPNTNYKFVSLTATDSVIKVNNYTTIKAIVDPADPSLAYKWECTQGTITGQGSSIQFTVCHQSEQTIKCTVAGQVKEIKISAKI